MGRSVKDQIYDLTEGVNMREACGKADVPYEGTTRWIRDEPGRRLAVEHLESLCRTLGLEITITAAKKPKPKGSRR